MPLKDKILRFIKGLKSFSVRKGNLPEEAPKGKFIPNPTGKRPRGFTMPEWAKGDYFQKEDLGTMVPPEELAEEATLRRPADWLRDKIGGSDKVQQFENIKKSKEGLQRKVGMSDQEIETFLGKFLKGSKKRSSRKAGKKGRTR